MGYNEDDWNEMDIPDQEFTLNEVAVSTSNDQAMIELTKALEEDQRPPLPAIAEKPKQRFKSLTVEELCEIESKKHYSTTKAKTKWGMKILQGGSKTCKKKIKIWLYTITKKKLSTMTKVYNLKKNISKLKK